jgi:nucleotide-binding universal stress UspA family protein
MIGKRPIVVGVDASPTSDLAVIWALHEARRAGLPVRLVHSVARAGLAEPAIYALDEWTSAEAVLVHARALADEFPDVSVRADALEAGGPGPTAALVKASKDAEMVVLGALGHGAASGMVLGSVSQHVTRHAECPVVVVREPAELRARRIVVGVDGSQQSEHALQFALQVAAHDGRDVSALRAWRIPITPGGYGISLPLREDVDVERAAVQEQLDSCVDPWREKYPDVDVTTQAVRGHAIEALVDASAHAGLLVVGERGRGAFAGLLLGSVSHGVLERAECPVAIVR